MACKRTATSDLNHDNWDNEDEPEDAGTFVKAPPDVLEKRVVKMARRRLPRSSDVSSSDNTKSPFGLFSGFKTTPAPVASAFSFLSNTTMAESSSTTQTTATQSKSSTASNGAEQVPNKSTDSGNAISATETDKSSKDIQTNDKEDKIFKKSSDYFAKLKGLNESVTQWIKSHVDANPFCILTPIFRDYEKYIKDIEAKYAHQTAGLADDEIVPEKPVATSSKLSNSDGTMDKTVSCDLLSDEKKSTPCDNVKPTTNASMNWCSKKTTFGGANPSAKSPFDTSTDKKEGSSIFGNSGTESNPFLNRNVGLPQVTEDSEKSSGYGSFSQLSAASATFSFGQSTTSTAAPSAGFSFGSAKPFSFGSHVVAPQNSNDKADGEEQENEEEPPKPDFKPITEGDAFYEKRCKVFVKKDGNFSDRGVGILFLKLTPNGKTQLIVRADNSLGTLLINTLLTASIPTKRMNKNTVMLVCLPLPDSEPPPTPVLLRVKTPEDADSLIETLDNNKK